MRPYIEELARVADTYVCAYPNAGLPNPLAETGYDETPPYTAGLIREFAQKMDVAVGIIDVKNYYIETVEDVVTRIKKCLAYISPEKLAVAPDCGLSQTARWASRQKLINMVAGAKKVRATL